MEKTYNLIPIWNASIEIYKAIESICQRHNLRMYAGFGSALGAIRHKGFIPWDDDIDILMPRPDYEKFWEYAEKELPKYFKGLTFKIEKTYPYPFGKVFETRKDILNQLRDQSSLKLSNGISIDIFPLDGCPKSSISNFLWRFTTAVYKAAHWSCGEAPPRSVRLFYRMKYWFGKFFRIIFLKRYDAYALFCKIDKLVQKNEFDSSSYAGVIGCEYGEKAWRIPTSVYGKGTIVPFENTTIFVPDNCDAYLKSVYGDYMQLPPEEKQVPRHLL